MTFGRLHHCSVTMLRVTLLYALAAVYVQCLDPKIAADLDKIKGNRLGSSPKQERFYCRVQSLFGLVKPGCETHSHDVTISPYDVKIRELVHTKQGRGIDLSKPLTPTYFLMSMPIEEPLWFINYHHAWPEAERKYEESTEASGLTLGLGFTTRLQAPNHGFRVDYDLFYFKEGRFEYNYTYHKYVSPRGRSIWIGIPQKYWRNKHDQNYNFLMCDLKVGRDHDFDIHCYPEMLSWHEWTKTPLLNVSVKRKPFLPLLWRDTKSPTLLLLPAMYKKFRCWDQDKVECTEISDKEYSGIFTFDGGSHPVNRRGGLSSRQSQRRRFQDNGWTEVR